MLQLANIFQSGMVLQREKPLFIWGTADPKSTVNVSVQGQCVHAQSDEEGKWAARLAPLTASESEQMQIFCGAERIDLTDIAVGEVWVAGGQSNMEFHMRYEKHSSQVKSDCYNPRVRFYDVPEVAFEGQMECFDYSRVGIWRKATAEDIDYFSAVGYYFQRELEQALNVPVAIIGCNWGGSVSASWMNPETIRSAGSEWLEEYEQFEGTVDWKDYWQRQRTGVQNDRGNLFEDPFSEFMMPQTPSPEEADAFFKSMAESGQLPDMREDELMPSHFPGALYEHMVKEIAPFAVRGVLWYQGESDDEKLRAHLYQPMLTGLISDWRALWKDDALPFLIVQLPGFDTWMGTPNHRYDLIRDAQEQVARQVPHTYLCSSGDMGEQFDIHPKNKQPMGERLALLARGHVYGEHLLCDAPSVSNAKKEGKVITISFQNAEDGLVLEGETINALKLQSNGTPLSFRVELSENALILRLNEDAAAPIKVEFAQERFYLVNLYNKAHIPALPFSLTLEEEQYAD